MFRCTQAWLVQRRHILTEQPALYIIYIFSKDCICGVLWMFHNLSWLIIHPSIIYTTEGTLTQMWSKYRGSKFTKDELPAAICLNKGSQCFIRLITCAVWKWIGLKNVHMCERALVGVQSGHLQCFAGWTCREEQPFTLTFSPEAIFDFSFNLTPGCLCGRKSE